MLALLNRWLGLGELGLKITVAIVIIGVIIGAGLIAHIVGWLDPIFAFPNKTLDAALEALRLARQEQGG